MISDTERNLSRDVLILVGRCRLTFLTFITMWIKEKLIIQFFIQENCILPGPLSIWIKADIHKNLILP